MDDFEDNSPISKRENDIMKRENALLKRESELLRQNVKQIVQETFAELQEKQVCIFFESIYSCEMCLFFQF